MLPAFVLSEHTYSLALAVLIAAVYLALIRFADLNEKEPLWAVTMLFVFGGASAVLLNLVVSSIVLELTVVRAAIAEEAAKFVALIAGAAVLAVVSRFRGWSEIGGVMDGLVYGTAAGLGYATGEVFIQNLLSDSGLSLGSARSPLAILGATALSGLADGLFGAIIGAGFGAAAQSRSRAGRSAYPIIALVAAIIVHAAYTVLKRGGALGSTGELRAWAALVLPLIFIIALAVYALAQERRAIREELGEEAQTGAVTAEELRLLQNPAGRHAIYLKALARGDYESWGGLKSLHSRQVQLALAKRRAARAKEERLRAAIEAEVQALRSTVIAIKAALDNRSRPAGLEGATL